MGVDILRGRFTVWNDGKVNPVEIISESNVFCGYGSDQHQCRDFFSVTERCSLTDGQKYVDEDTARKCIHEHFNALKNDRGEVSDVYKGFPKTNRGFVNGFFRKQIQRDDYEQYHPDKAYHFEKYKYPRLGKL